MLGLSEFIESSKSSDADGSTANGKRRSIPVGRANYAGASSNDLQALQDTQILSAEDVELELRAARAGVDLDSEVDMKRHVSEEVENTYANDQENPQRGEALAAVETLQAGQLRTVVAITLGISASQLEERKASGWTTSEGNDSYTMEFNG